GIGNGKIQVSAMAVAGGANAGSTSTVAGNLDQCRDGGIDAFNLTGATADCVGSGSGSIGWVNGNAGASNAHNVEGGSLTYRLRLTNIGTVKKVRVHIGWDTVHSGAMALD